MVAGRKRGWGDGSGSEDCLRRERKIAERSGRGRMGENGGSSWRGNAALEREEELVMARGGDGGGDDGGAAVWRRRRRRRLEDSGVAMTAEKNPWPGQGVAAVVAAAAAAAAVGLLPRPSLSSHLRGRSLLSFFK